MTNWSSSSYTVRLEWNVSVNQFATNVWNFIRKKNEEKGWRNHNRTNACLFLRSISENSISHAKVTLKDGKNDIARKKKDRSDKKIHTAKKKIRFQSSIRAIRLHVKIVTSSVPIPWHILRIWDSEVLAARFSILTVLILVSGARFKATLDFCRTTRWLRVLTSLGARKGPAASCTIVLFALTTIFLPFPGGTFFNTPVCPVFWSVRPTVWPLWRFETTFCTEVGIFCTPGRGFWITTRRVPAGSCPGKGFGRSFASTFAADAFDSVSSLSSDIFAVSTVWTALTIRTPWTRPEPYKTNIPNS